MMRALLLALPGLGLLVAVALADGPPPSLEAKIAERLTTFRGMLGVAAKDLRTGEAVAVNADTLFPTATAIKTAVMVEVFHQIQEGRFRRDTT